MVAPPVAAPAPAPAAEVTAAPAVESAAPAPAIPTRAAPAVERPPAPREPLPAITPLPSSDSGLVLVETRHAAPAMEAEEAPASRPRRARPPRVSIPDEPLQIVETRKEQ
jgi:hypothetical protein